MSSYKIPGVLETLKDQLKERKESYKYYLGHVQTCEAQIKDLEESIKKLEK